MGDMLPCTGADATRAGNAGNVGNTLRAQQANLVAGRWFDGIDPVEPKLGQIELVDKGLDHPNRIVLADPIFQAFRK